MAFRRGWKAEGFTEFTTVSLWFDVKLVLHLSLERAFLEVPLQGELAEEPLSAFFSRERLQLEVDLVEVLQELARRGKVLAALLALGTRHGRRPLGQASDIENLLKSLTTSEKCIISLFSGLCQLGLV